MLGELKIGRYYVLFASAKCLLRLSASSVSDHAKCLLCATVGPTRLASVHDPLLARHTDPASEDPALPS